MPGAGETFTSAVATRSSADRDGELYIRRDRFREVDAAGLSPRVSRVLSVTQRPHARGAPAAGSGPPATWAAKPSWYGIATADPGCSTPPAQRFMAQRRAAHEYLPEGSHAVLLSRPDAVAAMTGRWDRVVSS